MLKMQNENNVLLLKRKTKMWEIRIIQVKLTVIAPYTNIALIVNMRSEMAKRTQAFSGGGENIKNSFSNKNKLKTTCIAC